MPDVSIIIPNYNGARFLREAIDSALAQAVDGLNIEVIVVDDGSTDGSLEILETYGDQICPIRQQNGGPCAARNCGLREASGTYIKFLDADDCLLPKSVSDQVKFSERASAHGEKPTIFVGDAQQIDSEGRLLAPNYLSVAGAGHAFTLVELIQQTLLTTLPLHYKTYLDQVGGFDERVTAGQDYDLSIRLFLHGCRFVSDGRPCYAYRQHDQSERVSTKRHSQSSFAARLACYERHLAAVRQSGNKHLWTDPLAAAFAANFWETGRFAVRCGQRACGERFFAKARELSPKVPSGRLGYRLLCRLFGPVRSELLLSQIRRRAPPFKFVP